MTAPDPGAELIPSAPGLARRGGLRCPDCRARGLEPTSPFHYRCPACGCLARGIAPPELHRRRGAA